MVGSAGSQLLTVSVSTLFCCTCSLSALPLCFKYVQALPPPRAYLETTSSWRRDLSVSMRWPSFSLAHRVDTARWGACQLPSHKDCTAVTHLQSQCLLSSSSRVAVGRSREALPSNVTTCTGSTKPTVLQVPDCSFPPLPLFCPLLNYKAFLQFYSTSSVGFLAISLVVTLGNPDASFSDQSRLWTNSSREGKRCETTVCCQLSLSKHCVMSWAQGLDGQPDASPIFTVME